MIKAELSTGLSQEIFVVFKLRQLVWEGSKISTKAAHKSFSSATPSAAASGDPDGLRQGKIPTGDEPTESITAQRHL